MQLGLRAHVIGEKDLGASATLKSFLSRGETMIGLGAVVFVDMREKRRMVKIQRRPGSSPRPTAGSLEPEESLDDWSE